MKNNYNIFALLLCLMALSFAGEAQDGQMHTQSIVKQEFVNPAYSSFKDYTSINLMSRHQWYNQMDGSPETYAANIYVPVSLSGFGLGLTAITETIGLRHKVSFSGSLSHNIHVGTSNYLGFGYGFGMQNNTYDMDRLRTYSDIIPAELVLNSTNFHATLGLFYYAPVFFVGLSSNTQFNKSKYNGSLLLPGFDFTSGLMYRISNAVIFRPDVVVKYYPLKSYAVESGQVSESAVVPVVDVSVNFLLFEKLWLGTSHRVGQTQTFSADFIVRETFKIGYTFELGIGQGVNQFDSYGLRLAWSIIPKRALQGFDRSERHNIPGMLNSYLYR